MIDGEGSEQKKEENRLVKRAKLIREQAVRASRVQQRTEAKSEQRNAENRSKKRADSRREQIQKASRMG
jgi:hypothetical protein